MLVPEYAALLESVDDWPAAEELVEVGRVDVFPKFGRSPTMQPFSEKE